MKLKDFTAALLIAAMTVSSCAAPAFSEGKECEQDGEHGSANGDYSIAYGNYATADGDSSVSLGYNADADASRTIAIGALAEAHHEDSIVIGGTRATGSPARVSTGAVAIGVDSVARGERSLALGHYASVKNGANDAVVVGANAVANGDSSIALGAQSSTENTGGIAIGNQAVSSGVSGTAIGYAAKAAQESSVALGASSQSDEANIVSVGNAGSKRAIKYIDARATSDGGTYALTTGQMYDFGMDAQDALGGTSKYNAADNTLTVGLSRDFSGFGGTSFKSVESVVGSIDRQFSSYGDFIAKTVGSSANGGGAAFNGGTGVLSISGTPFAGESTIAGGFDALDTRMGAAETTIAGHTASINDLGTRMGAAESNIDANTAAIAQEKTDREAAINKEVSDRNSAINTAKTELGGYIDTLGGSAADVIGNGVTYDAASHSLNVSGSPFAGASTIAGGFANLSSSVAALDTSIGSLGTKLDTLGSSLAGIIGDGASYNTSTGEMTGDIGFDVTTPAAQAGAGGAGGTSTNDIQNGGNLEFANGSNIEITQEETADGTKVTIGVSQNPTFDSVTTDTAQVNDSLTVGSGADSTTIGGGDINASGNITAGGDITASGTVSGATGSFGGGKVTADKDGIGVTGTGGNKVSIDGDTITAGDDTNKTTVGGGTFEATNGNGTTTIDGGKFTSTNTNGTTTIDGGDGNFSGGLSVGGSATFGTGANTVKAENGNLAATGEVSGATGTFGTGSFGGGKVTANGAGLAVTGANGGSVKSGGDDVTVTDGNGNSATVGGGSLSVSASGADGAKHDIKITGDGADMGGTKVTNMAEGEIAQNSTDAVTGGQVHSMGQSIAGLMGGDITLGAAGELEGGFSAGGASGLTLQGAISVLDKATGGGTGSIDYNEINLGDNITINEGGVTIEGDNVFDLGDTIHVTNEGMQLGDVVNVTQEGVSVGDVHITEGGIDMGDTHITNLAPGAIAPGSTDAVTGGQLWEAYNRMDDLGERINVVGAHAAALSGLHPIQYDPFEPTTLSAAFGTYRDEYAVAVGVFHYVRENVMFNMGASLCSDGDIMGRMGVSFAVGRSSDKPKVAATIGGLRKQVLEMQKELEGLRTARSENKAIKAELASLREKNERSEKALRENEKIMKQNAELIKELMKRLEAKK